MYTDLFANPSRDYVVPTIAPCPGDSGSEANLEFIKDGIGITSGSKILADIDFGDLKIPVESYSSESKIIKPGEVVYIQGLTKGLLNRNQSFSIPSLISSNISLNPFFYYIDLSINYISNFRTIEKDIDASASYEENISISDRLNILFGDSGIKITSSYQSDLISFTGDQEGYDFEISNVILHIIDSSQNPLSPFPNGINPSQITLEEDPSKRVEYAKYPNTAMQGVIMKGIYPNVGSPCSGTTELPQNFLMINHVTDWVTLYEPVSVNYDSEVQTGLHIAFDPSSFIGIKPIINWDFSIGSFVFNYDISIEIIEINIGALSDPSTDLIGITADNSILSYYNIISCGISDSSLNINNIFESSIYLSNLNINYIVDSIIKDSQIENCGIDISEILGNSVNDCSILESLIDDSSINYLAPSDFLAYYNFNNNLIGISDVSPNSWTPVYVDGVDGSALYVDGSVILYPGFSNPTNFTVSFWVKNGTHPTTDVIFEMASPSVPNDKNIRISISSPGMLTAIIEDNPSIEQSSAQDVSSGFNFVILTKNGGSYSLYVNDPVTPKWNSSLGLQPNISGTLNSIGSDIGGLDNIVATIDEFRIYNRVLSSEEREKLQINSIFYGPSSVSDSYIKDSEVKNSEILESYFVDSSIFGSEMNKSEILNGYIISSSLDECQLILGDLENVYLSDSSIFNVSILDASVDHCYIEDSSLSGGISISNEFNGGFISYIDSSSDEFYLGSISNSNIEYGYINDVSIFDSYFGDSSIIHSKVTRSDFISCFISDSSMVDCFTEWGHFSNSLMEDSSIINGISSLTEFISCTISDSSLDNLSIINNNSSVYNSTILNCYTNTYKLLSYIDPCTSIPVYNYVTEDDTLSIDSSMDRIKIYNSTIWDSSINNAIVYDSSIYNSLIEDSSLVRCTTYNCRFDPLTYFEDTRDILIDPSISAAYSIIKDTSIFYIKKIKRLDVGMSGKSSETIMSAGDYLDWVSSNNLWKKFGKFYVWTSSIDCWIPENKNLITGFYVFNPHTFDTKIEYLIFK